MNIVITFVLGIAASFILGKVCGVEMQLAVGINTIVVLSVLYFEITWEKIEAISKKDL